MIREDVLQVRLVARGNLDVSVVPSSRDEIGELVQSFNDMVKDLKRSRQELARAERESAWKEMAKQVAHEHQKPAHPDEALAPAPSPGTGR